MTDPATRLNDEMSDLLTEVRDLLREFLQYRKEIQEESDRRIPIWLYKCKELSHMTSNRCQSNGLKTIADVWALDPIKFKELPGVGKKAYREMMEVFKNNDIDPGEWYRFHNRAVPKEL